MTFCLGIKVSEGLVGIADTRVISGNENISARKISVYQQSEGSSLFLMTSGLRSVRDKAVTYFEDQSAYTGGALRPAVQGRQRFRLADPQGLVRGQGGAGGQWAHFNIYCLMGGRMSADDEPKLYLIYPQGNWVEIGQETPYHIIGSPGYGKPVLDRTLKYSDSMRFALKVGCLAFDSTRISAADVDFPIDVVLLFNDGRLVQRRFEQEELSEISDGWQERLRNSVTNLPSTWLDRFFEGIDGRPEIPSIYADTPT